MDKRKQRDFANGTLLKIKKEKEDFNLSSIGLAK